LLQGEDDDLAKAIDASLEETKKKSALREDKEVISIDDSEPGSTSCQEPLDLTDDGPLWESSKVKKGLVQGSGA